MDTIVKTIYIITIEGMTCDSCALHNKTAISNIPGVISIEIPDYESGEARIVANKEITKEKFIRAVKKVGYKVNQIKSIKVSSPKLDFVEKSANNDFDLLVIGGGSAGFAAAIKASELGYQVGLINNGTIGGTCVNTGCVPSKVLIRAVERFHNAGLKNFNGVITKAKKLNWEQVVEQKDKLVSKLRKNKYIDVLASYPNITLIKGFAKFITENKIIVNHQQFSSPKIIISTGASPWIPPISGLENVEYLTSATAMELNELPKSMVVIGANAVGLEQAQIFSRAGVNITLLELLPRIAPFEDEEISAELQTYLENEGIKIITSFKTNNISKINDNYRVIGEMNHHAKTVEAKQILIATGRRANTAGLGLENIGVKLGKRNEILIDATMRTSSPSIYAAGDVTGHDMFVYVAAYSGGLAAENALSDKKSIYDTDYLARVTFTDPQIASAGLTESQANQKKMIVKTSVLPMSYVPSALAARDTRGLIKIIAEKTSNRIVGVHILGPDAGEIIQIGSLAIKLGLTVDDISATLFPYLTKAEGIKLAALAFKKDISQLSCCAG